MEMFSIERGMAGGRLIGTKRGMVGGRLVGTERECEVELVTKCNSKFRTHLWEFICSLKGKLWWNLKDNLEEIQTKWMNLKFWSWELKLWTPSVFRRCGLDWWFPSREKLSKTSLAWKSWLWLDFNTKVNYLGIELFVQFWVSNDEMDSKIGMYVKNWARQVLLKNFDFWSRCMQKSTF